MAFRISGLSRFVATALFGAGLWVPTAPVPAFAAYQPPYAEMVVDARTGRVLNAVNPDALRHPASLTKVMTLYMLFEALETGKVTLNTDLKVSARAQRAAPSKLGLNAGDTIKVEDAIKALVTKSANDVAITVAENLGGTEDDFAQMMTRKAQSLGMKRTVYANASGLPNPKQLTTARDLITLGSAIQKRFPKYFAYFSLRSFEYEGTDIPTHNKLLGRIDGVDGIKTGYTQKSGFNLLTSVHTDNRSLLAVVLGGRSGRARDERMADLIDAYLPAASTPAQGAKLVKLPPVKAPKLGTPDDREPTTENEDDAEGPISSVPAPKELSPPSPKPAATTAALAPTPMPEFASQPAQESVTAQPSQLAAKPLAPLAQPQTQPSEPVQPKAQTKAQPLAAPESPNSAPATALAYTPMTQPPVEPKEIAVTPNGLKLAWQTGAQAIHPNMTGSKRPDPSNSIYVQIGTAQTESDAKRLLSSARDKLGSSLSAANMLTEKVTVNGKILWRARFNMSDESLAHDACKTLKKNKMSCFVSRG